MTDALTPDWVMIDAWLQTYAISTARNYLTDMLDFMSWIAIPLKEVESHHIEEYLNQLTTSVPVQRRTHHSIKRMFNYGFATGYLPRDPAEHLLSNFESRDRNIPPETLSREQVNALFAAATTPRNKIMIGMFYYAAISAIEAATLRWSAVTITDGEIEVNIQTKPRLRRVKLPFKFASYLAKLKGKSTEDDPVFRSRVGYPPTPLTARSIARIFETIAAEAGLPPQYTIRSLRFSFAEHALLRGASLEAVRDALGVSSFRPLRRNKPHPTPLLAPDNIRIDKHSKNG